MTNKILIVSSLDKNCDYKDKVAVDNYIKLAIESGSLVKINYVNKEVQDFYRACINNEVYNGQIDTNKVKSYIYDYQTSNKILLVDENGYNESLINFPTETTDFVLEDNINKDEDNWVDFGGLEDYLKKEKKPKEFVTEKTKNWSMLFAILPYMYFIVNYSRRFTSVLTIATIWSVGILVYQLAKRRSNMLNYSMVAIFGFVWVLRLANPYWINSIAAILITLGLGVVFLAGEFLENGILSLYYNTSQRKPSDFNKFTVMWLLAFGIILGSIIYFGGVRFILSGGLLFLVWIITSVNLKGCEVEIIKDANVAENQENDKDMMKNEEISEEMREEIRESEEII